MAIDEHVKRELVQGFGQIMRQSALGKTIEVQRAMLGFGAVLEHSDGAVVDLSTFYAHLVNDLKAKEVAALEVLVVFKDRCEKAGIELVLPDGGRMLSDAERKSVVEAFMARAGEHARPGYKKDAPPPPPSPTPRTGQANGPALGVEPSGAFKRPGKRRRLLVALTCAAALALVGDRVWSSVRSTGETTTVEFAGGQGLPCPTGLVNNGVVVCRIPKAFAEGHSREALLALGKATLGSAKTTAATTLYVISAEDNRVRIKLSGRAAAAQPAPRGQPSVPAVPVASPAASSGAASSGAASSGAASSGAASSGAASSGTPAAPAAP